MFTNKNGVILIIKKHLKSGIAALLFVSLYLHVKLLNLKSIVYGLFLFQIEDKNVCMSEFLGENFFFNMKVNLIVRGVEEEIIQDRY